MQPSSLPRTAPLIWLALGAFAIGTEGFMITALLPEIAAAGQLVTVFALAYALSSPVLTALTGHLNRRRLLIGAMVAFAACTAVRKELKRSKLLLSFLRSYYSFSAIGQQLQASFGHPSSRSCPRVARTYGRTAHVYEVTRR